MPLLSSGQLSFVSSGDSGIIMKVNRMKKAEYKEGPEARENFERLAKAVLRAGNPKKQPKKAVKRRKTPGKSEG